MQLKSAIKEIGIPPNDLVYIHFRNRLGEIQEVQAKDIPEKELKTQVDIIQYGHGNREIGFKHYMFVLKK